MKRNPHPARRSRIATLGISSTAFVSIVTSLAWNTHQAELAASVTDANAVPVETTAPASSAITPASASTTSAVTPAVKIAPTAPATPAKSTNTSAPAAPAPTVAPATPVTPAAPTTAAPAPAPTVVYTCMSPGGKTENPTASGSCKNAQYGYVLTQI